MKKRIATAIFLTMLLTLAGGCTDSKDTASSSSILQTEQQTTEPATDQETLVSTASSTEAAETEQPQAEITALEPKPLNAKSIDKNPYMFSGDTNIHHDCYNTDSTDSVLPVGINPEVHYALEKQNANASPAIFFDSYGNAVVPLLGGIAIRDLNGEECKTLGYFSPKKHDGGGYVIQSSYSFIDESNRIVCPTSNNHVLMIKATDENGVPLAEFEKVLDIDIKAAAEKALGKTLDQNLLSVVFDYDGNLWFATGGFRIYPDRKQTGAIGYIARTAIDEILAEKNPDLDNAIFVQELEAGEGAENGIASSKDGAVILTNQACYLLTAENGVTIKWRTEYESVGAKDSREDAATTGGGLAWGSGCSPSLTKDLVFFTDNLEPVNLIALDMKTGKKVASQPVIDDLPEDMPVSVENSAIVYDNGEGTVSTIVCNWFGAGSPNLAKPDSDSSIQSYENIYDSNWLTKGNVMIMPGVERVDTVKTDNGYEMKSVWCRDDIRDTSMMKLSTATGYIYGYVQDIESGMWQYIVLDFETGETKLAIDVASKPGYNNMAIGMYAGDNGNALYCPTGYLELLRLQDRFVFLPEMPYRKVNLDQTSHKVMKAETFKEDGGVGTPASWLHSVSIENVHPKTTVVLKMNGLSGYVSDYKLYAYGKDGKLVEVASDAWSFLDAEGKCESSNVYDISITVDDDGTYDCNEESREISISVIFAK